MFLKNINPKQNVAYFPKNFNIKKHYAIICQKVVTKKLKKIKTK